jgi:hypothetical protein
MRAKGKGTGAPDAKASAAEEAEDESWYSGEEKRVGGEHVEGVGHAEEVAHVGEEVERRGVAEAWRGHEQQRRGEDGAPCDRTAAVLGTEHGGREGPEAEAAAAAMGVVRGEMHADASAFCLWPVLSRKPWLRLRLRLQAKIFWSWPALYLMGHHSWGSLF